MGCAPRAGPAGPAADASQEIHRATRAACTERTSCRLPYALPPLLAERGVHRNPPSSLRFRPRDTRAARLHFMPNTAGCEPKLPPTLIERSAASNWPKPATGRLGFCELAAQKTNFDDLCQARWECRGRDRDHVSAMAFGHRDRARCDRLYDSVG